MEVKTAGGRGVLEGAFSLLEVLARMGEAGLTRLATGAGLPKATTHRLLDQLVGLGIVQRRAGRYRMGPHMFHLGQAAEPIPVLRGASRFALREYAAAFREASVAVLVPATLRRSLVVSYIHGESDQDRPVRAGTLLPHGCAGDMVFAAGARGLPVPACYSETEWARLVGRACDQGIAFDHQYISPTVTCVAAPVRTPSGKIVAAVGAAVVDRRRLAAIANGARRTAEVIGANLARLPATHRALSPWLDDLTFSGTPSRRNGQ